MRARQRMTTAPIQLTTEGDHTLQEVNDLPRPGQESRFLLASSQAAHARPGMNPKGTQPKVGAVAGSDLANLPRNRKD